MFQLRENEKMLLVIRKHWFLMAGPVLVFIILVTLPLLLRSIIFLPAELEAEFGYLFPLGYILYALSLLILLFFAWTVYYLDQWMVTSERLIDIEQHGLFSREVSEIPLHRVQDVTMEVHGLLETLLHFGTIKIQTAGEREFLIRGVPHLTEIKDTILKYAHPETVTKISSV